MCQTRCYSGFAYWTARICVELCPSSPSMWSYVNGDSRICVTSCNSSSTDLFGD